MHKNSYIYLLFFLQIGYHCEVFSQIYPFRSYTTKDGLLSNVINCISQDSKGFIWIGTGEGLSRYDGRTFTNYSPADGLPFNSVSDIIEDRSSPGTLWVGTQGGGITAFSNGAFKTYTLDSGFYSGIISRLIQDRQNRIWCATGNGVYILNNGISQKFRPDITYHNLTDIALEGDSILWVAEFTTLHRISIIHKNHRVYDIGSHTKYIPYSTSLFLGSDNKLWVGGTDGSVLLFEHGELTHRKNFGLASITHIIEDFKGFIWVGTFSGLIRLPKNEFFTSTPLLVTNENGLIENSIKCTYIDRESNYWFGSYTQGLSKLTERQLMIFPLETTPPTPNNTTGTVDQRNHIWVCSYSGLYEFAKTVTGEWKKYLHSFASETTSKQHFPISVCFDSKNRCWLLFEDGILTRYDISKQVDEHSEFTRTKILDPTSTYGVGVPFFCIIDDHDRLWYVDANKGIYVFDPENKFPLLRFIARKDGLPSTGIRALYQDHTGTMWFGCNGEGLAKLTLSRFMTDSLTLYTEKDGLASNAIRSLFQDHGGTLWIGTRYNGLSLFQNNSFTNLDMRKGMLSNTIWRMTQDSSGRLWFGTPTGVMYLENNNYREFRPFERQLIATQVSGLGTTKTGEVWCLTGNSLTIFNPSQTSEIVLPPPVYITHCFVNGVDAEFSAPINLKYDQNNLVIEFIGIGFRDESIMKYEYRLLGAEDSWQTDRKENTITYGALQPGTYTFEVKAINSDNIQSVMPARLHFVIASPFWRAWWFIGALVMFVLGGTYLLYRYRVYQMVKLERLRARIARDLHDDVGSTLGSIALYTENLKRQLKTDSPISHKLLEKISSLSYEAEDAMSDVIWSTAPEHDSFEEMLIRMRDLTSQTCTAYGILFTIRMPEHVEKIRLPDAIRKNLYLIFKEGLNNIIKHSQATSLEFMVEFQDSMISMNIKDNGKGFLVKTESDSGSSSVSMHQRRGHGLRNMRRRAEEIGATFAIEAYPEQGTSIVVSIKMT